MLKSVARAFALRLFTRASVFGRDDPVGEPNDERSPPVVDFLRKREKDIRTI